MQKISICFTLLLALLAGCNQFGQTTTKLASKNPPQPSVNPQNETQNEAPKPPQNLVARMNSNRLIELVFEPPPKVQSTFAVKSINIYRGESKIASVEGATSVFYDSAIDPSTIYYYQVTAVDMAGTESIKSNVAFVYTPPIAIASPNPTQIPIPKPSQSPIAPTPSPISDSIAPSVPRNPTISETASHQVEISFGPSFDNVNGSGLKQYLLYRDGIVVAAAPPNAKRILDFPNLTGQTYIYQVSAIDNAGNESQKSKSRSYLPGKIMTFSDEFNGTTVDKTKWNKLTHWGHVVINGEMAFYAEDAFDFTGEVMRIRAERRRTSSPEQPADQNYTTGELSSHDKFAQAFGYFEMRGKVQKGAGLWPAFWLMTASKVWPPEIDVFEFIGGKPDMMALTYHYKGSQGEHLSSHLYHVPPGMDWSQDFHTWAVDWRANKITWYIDNEIIRTYTGPSIYNQPMYIIANMAIGPPWSWGGNMGDVDKNMNFPAYFDIDYIRVYK